MNHLCSNFWCPCKYPFLSDVGSHLPSQLYADQGLYLVPVHQLLKLRVMGSHTSEGISVCPWLKASGARTSSLRRASLHSFPSNGYPLGTATRRCVMQTLARSVYEAIISPAEHCLLPSLTLYDVHSTPTSSVLLSLLPSASPYTPPWRSEECTSLRGLPRLIIRS